MFRSALAGISVDKPNKFTPSYAVLGGLSLSIPSNSDLNEITTIGLARYSQSGAITSSIQNKPSDLSYAFTMWVLPMIGDVNGTNLMQVISPFELPGVFYIRHKKTSGWTSWNKFSGTSV